MDQIAYKKPHFLHSKCGAHVPLSSLKGSKGLPIHDTISDAIISGMYAVQFFLGNPHSLDRRTISEVDVNQTNSLTKIYPMHIFSHFPYISNLCGSVKGLFHPEKLIRSVEVELKEMGKIGGSVVIHPGSFPDRRQGMDQIAASINALSLDECGGPQPSKLLLENCAGEGSKIFRTLDEAEFILGCIDEKKRERVGLCLDTAHLWGDGEFDLKKPHEIVRLFDTIDSFHHVSRSIEVIHLNDSQVEKGSKKDRHESLGHGRIWSEDDEFESLRLLLDILRKRDIPAVLETPLPWDDLEVLMSLKY
jgi:deoxyribonuclease-4